MNKKSHNKRKPDPIINYLFLFGKGDKRLLALARKKPPYTWEEFELIGEFERTVNPFGRYQLIYPHSAALTDKKIILSVQEAALHYGLHPRTIRRLCRSAKLPAKKIGRDWQIEITKGLWKKAYSAPWVAKICGVTPTRVRKMIEDPDPKFNKLQSYKIGFDWRIPSNELVEYRHRQGEDKSDGPAAELTLGSERFKNFDLIGFVEISGSPDKWESDRLEEYKKENHRPGSTPKDAEKRT